MDDRQIADRREAGERQMRDIQHMPDTQILADDRQTMNERRMDERPNINRILPVVTNRNDRQLRDRRQTGNMQATQIQYDRQRTH